MKAALIQAPLLWEDPTGNRNYFSQKIDGITAAFDLIVLPEMFTTGFSINPIGLAEAMDGETVKWMQSVARKKNAAVMGSIIINENGFYYNRMVFVFPSGKIETYDKRHLFSHAGEDQIYTPGSAKLIVDYANFKICVLICYDLRFPVFSRNSGEYDLLIYVANWPRPRIQAWDSLLRARAIENMCYVIGVNRIGSDFNGHQYPGHSQAVDAFGNYIIEPSEGEGIFIASLDLAELTGVREKFSFLDDRDDFTVMLS